MKIKSDKELIGRCIEGSPEAWSDFVDRFSGLIYWAIKRKLSKYCLSYLLSDADDIYQRLFTSLFEKKLLLSIKERDNISPWLVVMASNMTIDFIRKKVREDSFLSDDQVNEAVACDNADPWDSCDTKMLSKAMKLLNEKERAYIEFHYVSGKKHKDIALIFNTSVNTVSTVIHRAKKKMLKYIEMKSKTLKEK